MNYPFKLANAACYSEQRLLCVEHLMLCSCFWFQFSLNVKAEYIEIYRTRTKERESIQNYHVLNILAWLALTFIMCSSQGRSQTFLCCERPCKYFKQQSHKQDQIRDFHPVPCKRFVLGVSLIHSQNNFLFGSLQRKHLSSLEQPKSWQEFITTCPSYYSDLVYQSLALKEVCFLSVPQ